MMVRSNVAPVRPAASVLAPAAAQPAAPVKAPVKAPVAAPAKPAPPVQPKMADRSFGSEIFQSGLYSLMNLGQIIPLGSLSGLIQMLPGSMLGGFNMVMGAMNGFKDFRSLKGAGNTKNGDNYTRLAGDAAVVAGGAALLFGAAVAPVVPLIGAGLAGIGFLTRIVGVWNDETRI